MCPNPSGADLADKSVTAILESGCGHQTKVIGLGYARAPECEEDLVERRGKDPEVARQPVDMADAVHRHLLPPSRVPTKLSRTLPPPRALLTSLSDRIDSHTATFVGGRAQSRRHHPEPTPRTRGVRVHESGNEYSDTCRGLHNLSEVVEGNAPQSIR